MRNPKKAVAIASLFLFGTSGAHASVIYNWQPLTDTDDFSVTGGQVVITDAAFASGSAMFDGSLQSASVPLDTAFPDSPIESVRLDVTNPGARNPLLANGPEFNIEINPTQGFDANSSVYSLQADLFTVGEMLTGSLDLLTFQDAISLSADDEGLWTIGQFASDAGSPRCFSGLCAGGTGRFILAATETPVDVPAPPVWALFGFAVAGLFGAKRRRRQA